MTDELSAEELALLQSMFDLARHGDAALLEHVDRGIPVDLTNTAGDTLLVLAAYHRHADLVRGLLERGADVTWANDRGQTALAAAVFRRDADIVTALLDAGADPTAGSRSALATAEVFDLPDMTALLRR